MTTAPTRKKGSTYNLCCGAYKSYGADECSSHFIDYDLLYKVVKDELQALLRLTTEDKQEILDGLNRWENKREKGRWDQREGLQKKEKRAQEVDALIKKAFELFALGKQSEAT